MDTIRLFVDMDGTLAQFHSEVDCLERMYQPGFFEQLKPYGNMVHGVRQFMLAHPEIEVFILSSIIEKREAYGGSEKDLWLDRWLAEIDKAHRIYVPVGEPKANHIPKSVSAQDYLLDDFNKNLAEWELAGGSTIKCHNDINQLGRYGPLWTGRMVHTHDLPQMICADLAREIGISYDAQKVMDAYFKPEHSQMRDAFCSKTSLHNANILDALRSSMLTDVPHHFDNQLLECEIDGSRFLSPRWRCEAVCHNELGISLQELSACTIDAKKQVYRTLKGIEDQIHKPVSIADRLAAAKEQADQRNLEAHPTADIPSRGNER